MKKIKKDWAAWIVVLLMTLPVILLFLFQEQQNFRQTAPKSLKNIEISVDIIKAPKRSVKSKSEKLKSVKSASMPSSPQTPKSNNKKFDGALPPVSANYRKHVGFSRYAQEMTKRGARFFIMGINTKKMIEIDFDNRTLMPVELNSIKATRFSPRSRCISDEPALNYYLKKSEKQFNLTRPEVFLLVPTIMENNIFSQLSAQKLPLQKISALKGFYCLAKDGGLTLNLNEAITINGNEKINVTINL